MVVIVVVVVVMVSLLAVECPDPATDPNPDPAPMAFMRLLDLFVRLEFLVLCVAPGVVLCC